MRIFGVGSEFHLTVFLLLFRWLLWFSVSVFVGYFANFHWDCLIFPHSQINTQADKSSKAKNFFPPRKKHQNLKGAVSTDKKFIHTSHHQYGHRTVEGKPAKWCANEKDNRLKIAKNITYTANVCEIDNKHPKAPTEAPKRTRTQRRTEKKEHTTLWQIFQMKYFITTLAMPFY